MPEDFNTRVIREFRENDGRVGPPFEGAAMILVHHTGAKSGTERVTPLVYFPDGERYLIVASAAGAPHNPAWFHNITANPRITVEVATSQGAQTEQVVAEEVVGEQRATVWARIVQANPGFGEYAKKTEGIRTIPVVALTPA
ncbi:MAG: nitroreductase family deazaflavin-dependent oxidoreductase [Geodermatophilaceae bacterium]|nr:nitroreductase family deazaflavin-dependent oxidoreductase [Geodermatophilaceae bacterium]